jgi:subtilisin family serine protease
MARRKNTQRTPRAFGRVEHLEDRRYMSADPVADLLPPVDHFATDDQLPMAEQQIVTEPDFWVDTSLQTGLENSYYGGLEQMLTQAHNLTGWFNVKKNYGFTGRGQTVAVIDSGIAWNHFALGGGLGQGYRVVGGWDFTEENDANPYDDGSSGGHGTHVSGIIGSSDGTNTGVAPGVDLVGLRVLNDSGQGFFTWIENSLRWVLNNRNSFANPITAINLSLGVSSWNSATIPAWANLEDEFQQLKEAGIFIAVSAGNSYSSFNTTGLSYPAASQYVVPVMSVNDAGQMSAFSQRMTRAIAAPGQSIVSSAPDYKGNNNGVADDWATMSGTSMAAPYVAGASVLIRQAMQFVGMTNINQDTIYNHMMATADTFYDAATSLNYKRLNLARAIDALMPADDYGSTAAAAYNLGTMNGSTSTSGLIGQLTDVDCFKFTAASSGRVMFTATGSAGMNPSWQVWGATPLSNSAAGAISFNVIAGQTYTVGIGSSSGMGSYELSSTFEATAAYTEWGAIDFNAINDVAVAGERMFRVQATRNGLLTVVGLYTGAASSVRTVIYDVNMNELHGGIGGAGWARADSIVTAGHTYFIRILGTSNDVDVKLGNMVAESGGVLTVVGSSGNDSMAFVADATTQLVSVNGIEYGYASSALKRVLIDGGGGNDAFTYYGRAINESATLRVGSAVINATGFQLTTTSTETQRFVGGGGTDDATFYDSSGSDIFTATPIYATFVGTGFSNRAENIRSVTAISNAGGIQIDRAYLYGSSGDDLFDGRPDVGTFTGATFVRVARGFDRVDAYGAGGNDRANLYDSSKNDTFVGSPTSSSFTGEGFANAVWGFGSVYAHATADGYDVAHLYDSAGNDRLNANSDYTTLEGAEFYLYAKYFDQVNSTSTGGLDLATFIDSMGNDSFISTATGVSAAIGHSRIATTAFSQARITATAGGIDKLDLRGLTSSDVVYGRGNSGSLTRAASRIDVAGLDEITLGVAVGVSPNVDVRAVDYLFNQVGA